MNILIQMWNTAANYTQWQAIWISSVFLLINGGLCATVWYVQRLTIIRYGFSRYTLILQEESYYDKHKTDFAAIGFILSFHSDHSLQAYL